MVGMLWRALAFLAAMYAFYGVYQLSGPRLRPWVAFCMGGCLCYSMVESAMAADRLAHELGAGGWSRLAVATTGALIAFAAPYVIGLAFDRLARVIPHQR